MGAHGRHANRAGQRAPSRQPDNTRLVDLLVQPVGSGHFDRMLCLFDAKALILLEPFRNHDRNCGAQLFASRSSSSSSSGKTSVVRTVRTLP